VLYDPKWEKTVNPLKIEALIAWLATQNPATSYDYTDPRLCLAAQYFKHHGVTPYCLTSFELDEAIPGLQQIVYAHDGASPEERTFGAALARARAALLSVAG
jgi:hypothetical protein